MEVDLNESGLPAEFWMVKPCEWYKEEYRDCYSFKAMFNQYFIYGKVLDCKEWLRDYEHCLNWRKFKDSKYLELVMENEKRRIGERMKAAKENDVWELRNEPPKNWNKPLPDYIIENHADSIFEKRQKELKNIRSPQNSSKFCSIL